MGQDINIPMSELEQLNSSLKNIIAEFEAASSRSNALEGWIGNPHGETQLRDEIDRFESAWNDKRDTLKDDITSVQESVEGVAKAWADFDNEMATNLDQTTNDPQVQKPE